MLHQWSTKQRPISGALQSYLSSKCKQSGCLFDCKDLGLFSSEIALCPTKVRRQRSAWRKSQLTLNKEENQGIICLDLDGQIDVNLTQCANHTGRKYICRKIQKEHYILVSFSSRSHVEHVPGSRKSANILLEIMSMLRESKSESTSRALVFDGAGANTGKNNEPDMWTISFLIKNVRTNYTFICIQNLLKIFPNV